MKRIRSTAAVLCSMIVLCLTAEGCSAQQEEIEAEKENLLLWSYYETGEQRNTLDEIVREFNGQQDTYRLSWEYVPMTEFKRRLAIGVTGEKTPDIVIMDNPDMNSCIQQGMIEDMTSELEDTDEDLYFPQVWESVMYDGKIYGIPFCCNSLMLFYNKDLFEQNGLQPPSTPEQLYETAKKLTAQERKGFAMSAVSGEQGAFQILTWILNEGESINTLGGEKTSESFSFVKKLTDENIMDIQCINWTQIDVCRKFIEGETAMMLNGPWVFDMLEESGISYDVASIPSENTPVSVIGGENLGAVKGKNKEGAAEFMKFYSQNDVMYDACIQQGALPPKIELAEKAVQQDKRFEQVKTMVETGVARTSIPNWQNLSEKLTEALREVILGEKTPEEAAAQIKF